MKYSLSGRRLDFREVGASSGLRALSRTAAVKRGSGLRGPIAGGGTGSGMMPLPVPGYNERLCRVY